MSSRDTQVRSSPMARTFAAEFTVFSSAFFPRACPDPDGVSYFESTAAGQFAPVLFFVLSLETVGLHLILYRWSHLAAWLMTALDVYGLIFAIGFYRSLKAKPHLLTPGELTLRMGFLSQLRIERDWIAKWSKPSPNFNPKEKGTWRGLTLGDGPQFVLEFNQPVESAGLYGARKTFQRAAFSADQPGRVTNWLNQIRPNPPASS